MKPALAIIAALALTVTGCGKKDEPPKPKTSESTSIMPVAGVNVSRRLAGRFGP